MIAQRGGDRLHSIFFRLIQAGNGYITVFHFEMEAQLTTTAAKQYLDEKAKEFDATFDISDEGVISCCFLGSSTSYISDSSSITTTNNQHQFEIFLEDSGQNKIVVMKLIREFTGLGLKEAKNLVEATPIIIKSGFTRVIAEDIKKQLEQVGAKATVW